MQFSLFPLTSDQNKITQNAQQPGLPLKRRSPRPVIPEGRQAVQKHQHTTVQFSPSLSLQHFYLLINSQRAWQITSTVRSQSVVSLFKGWGLNNVDLLQLCSYPCSRHLFIICITSICNQCLQQWARFLKSLSLLCSPALPTAAAPTSLYWSVWVQIRNERRQIWTRF